MYVVLRRILEEWSVQFETLGETLAGTPEGLDAQNIASAWIDRTDMPSPRPGYTNVAGTTFSEDAVTRNSRKQCAMVRTACRVLREQWVTGDPGPTYILAPSDSIVRMVGHFSFEACREAQHGGCVIGFGKNLQVSSDDIRTCLESKPQCYKNRRLCMGRCGGDNEEVLQDFATSVSKSEMGDFTLKTPTERDAAAADCRVRTGNISIPWFEGGDAFETYAARVRSRSGFTAIDPKQCADNVAACAAVAKVLETAPTLIYVPGRGFVRREDVTAPSPPPPPPPPDRSHYNYRQQPDPPPPPPSPPPPWYDNDDVGDCLPLPTAFSGGSTFPRNRSVRPAPGRRPSPTLGDAPATATCR